MSFHWWLSDYVSWYGAHFTIAWVLWVIISITFHELSHGWMAIRCGDDVPIHSGHMTWNPFVHIPFPQAWIMFGVFGFTWGLMPVGPDNFRGRYDESKVAFAGPAMNLLLCGMCIAADVAWLVVAKGVQEPVNQTVHTVLWVGIVINMMGFLFNLIPVPPLDGSRILANFIPSFRNWQNSEGGQVGTIVAMIALFYFGSQYVWGFVFGASHLIVALLTTLLGGEYRDPYVHP